MTAIPQPDALHSEQVDEESVIAFPRSATVRPSFEYERSDQGNADYFVDLFGSRLRFDHARQRWLIWRRNRWQEDRKGAVNEAAQYAARRRLREARRMPAGSTDANGKPDAEAIARREAIQWALRSENRGSRDSMLSTVQFREPIAIHSFAEGWDADPMLLGVPNGIVDLRTGKLRDADRIADKITMQTRVAFDPHAKCPRWELFLSQVFCGDQEMVSWIGRVMGYSLTGDVREDRWFDLHGSGGNGKSTLLGVWCYLLGDYGHTAPITLVEQGQNARFQTTDLQHRRCVLLSEVSQGSSVNDSMLKLLTGRDLIPAEIKHVQGVFHFDPTHKLFVMGNHKMKVNDLSKAFWSRVCVVPLNHDFRQDPNREMGLLEYFKTQEAQGILSWGVRMCLEWQKRGLDPMPQQVRDASLQYQTSQDVLHDFLSQHVKKGDKGYGQPSFTLRGVYRLYLDWCSRSGIKQTYNQRNLCSMLEERGLQPKFTTSGARGFYGELHGYQCTCLKAPCVCWE
jgi:putative DNA primase/helicase